MGYTLTSVFEVSTNQRIVADSGGNVNADTGHYRYSAFGEVEVYSPSGSSPEVSDIENSVLWNSRRYDAQTQLHYYKYRHYQPATGRWPSRDPLGDESHNMLVELLGPSGTAPEDKLTSDNLYNFAFNDSINHFDVNGEWIAAAARIIRPAGRAIGAGIGAVIVHQARRRTARVAAQQARERARRGARPRRKGDCSAAEHAALQAAVNAACKIKRACKCPPVDCAGWRQNVVKNNACKKARQAINRKCFKGGNPGHRQAAADAGKAAAKCLKLIGQHCN